VNNVSKAVENYIKHIDRCTSALRDKFREEYNSDWISFATNCHKEPYFGLSRNLIETPEEYRRKRNGLIIKNASKLNGAKQITEKWKS